MAGTVLLLGEWCAVLGLVIMFVSFWRKLRLEETWLGEYFGPAYGEYLKRIMVERFNGRFSDVLATTRFRSREDLQSACSGRALASQNEASSDISIITAEFIGSIQPQLLVFNYLQ